MHAVNSMDGSGNIHVEIECNEDGNKDPVTDVECPGHYFQSGKLVQRRMSQTKSLTLILWKAALGIGEMRSRQ